METIAKPTLRQRSVHELKEFAILYLYLYIALGAVILMKTATLHTYGIGSLPWGAAVVKAAVLAKFMLIGRAMKIGERQTTSPLIWPTLYKSFAFLVLLVVLTIIEEAVVGLFHHQSIAASLGELFGARLEETMAGILIVLLVLIPYFAFRVLGDDARRREASEDVFCRARADAEVRSDQTAGSSPYCRAIAMRMASSGGTR